MYRIAICDNDSEVREQIQKQVMEVLGYLGVKGEFCQWSRCRQGQAAQLPCTVRQYTLPLHGADRRD